MSEEKMPCPFCDSGALEEMYRDREMDFEGDHALVHGLLYSVCNHCAIETVTPNQSRLNKKTIINAHKTAQGLMTAEDICALRKQLGITQIEAATLFGGGVNAFSKYENNAITQTKAMDTMLQLVRDVPEAARYLAKRKNVKLRSIVPPTTQQETIVIGKNKNIYSPTKSVGGNVYEIYKKGVSQMITIGNDIEPLLARAPFSLIEYKTSGKENRG